jgi:TolA-binding protein
MKEKDSTKRTPYELFSGSLAQDPQGKDLFLGKPPATEKGLSMESAQTGAPEDAQRMAGQSKGHFFWALMLLVVNCFMVGGILCYLLLQTEPRPAADQPMQAVQAAPSKAANSELTRTRNQSIDPAKLFESVHLSNATVQALEGSISLRAADALYKAQDYFKACYVYDRLRDNLMINDLADACLDDYLALRMALCLQKSQEQELMLSLFTQALESRSPVVRTLAYYNLSFLQMHNQQFLAARTSAYRALALVSCLGPTMPETVEADCYFLVAEALTRYILKLQNEMEGLPGRLWSDMISVTEVPLGDQDSLKVFLRHGIEEINAGAVSPKIQYYPQRETGAQWSAVCLKAPIEEIIWKYATAANMTLRWDKADIAMRKRPVTLYLPLTAGTYLAEVAVGSAGLLWRYDGESAFLYDPETYTDFDKQRQAIAAESIAIWQRFLLRYRGDHRTPNAHYALGILYTIEDQPSTALSQYKLISAQFPHNPLAPYSLLKASKLKTDLRDFGGARTDLNDLLMQYPDSRLVDEASLHLAETTLAGGLYEDAGRMFEKVYALNISETSRCSAAYGLGRCAYEQGDWAAARKWLSQAIDLMTSSGDWCLGTAYTLLGRICTRMGDYETASCAFRTAMDKQLSSQEYFDVTMELIAAKTSQQQYLEALEILESIPEPQLSQEQICEVMLSRSRILRDIDLAESAVSLLRRRIQFVAQANLRAKLSVELARCYLQTGDLAIAEKELSDAIYDLEDKTQTGEAMVMLAEVVYRRGRLGMAEEICRQILSQEGLDRQIQQDAYILMGRLYRDQKRPEQAALAYAGLPLEEGRQP